MIYVANRHLYFTGIKSRPRGLPVVFEVNNVARCGDCLVSVRLNDHDVLVCPECHRWRKCEEERKKHGEV